MRLSVTGWRVRIIRETAAEKAEREIDKAIRKGEIEIRAGEVFLNKVGYQGSINNVPLELSDGSFHLGYSEFGQMRAPQLEVLRQRTNWKPATPER